jgi:hypothetical protein
MATKGVKRRQKKSAVEAVGPPLAWGAYYKGLAAQHDYILRGGRSWVLRNSRLPLFPPPFFFLLLFHHLLLKSFLKWPKRVKLAEETVHRLIRRWLYRRRLNASRTLLLILPIANDSFTPHSPQLANCPEISYLSHSIYLNQRLTESSSYILHAVAIASIVEVENAH